METLHKIFSYCIFAILIISCSKNETAEINYLTTSDTLLSKKLMYERDEPGTLLTTTEYLYNNQRQLIKTISRYSSSGNYNYYDTLEYADNLLVKKTMYSYDYLTNHWKKSGTETHTYPDESTEVITNYIESNEYTNTTKIYRENNHIVKQEMYNEDFLYQTIYYSYLDNKLYSESCYFHENTEVSYKKTYSYCDGMVVLKNYDKNNTLTDIQIEKYCNGKLQSVYRKSYTWDMEKVVQKLEYDEYGRIAKEILDPLQLPIMSFRSTPKIVIYQY